MAITFSLENLVHFRCGICQQWWSIGDWKQCDEMTCTHCGKKQKVTQLQIKA